MQSYAYKCLTASLNVCKLHEQVSLRRLVMLSDVVMMQLFKRCAVSLYCDARERERERADSEDTPGAHCMNVVGLGGSDTMKR